MISSIISRIVILVFGTLYPAYASYKAVRTKNVKEYVKWMMYWIVFALFTCAETFTDVFFSWFPFYYEVKILLVLWLLSPATKGSSILYRKFVHPALCRREQEIDEYISKAKDQGYHTVLNLGTKGVNYATAVIMQTAIKGGGGLVQQLRRSYSLSDLSVTDDHSDCRSQQELDEVDDVVLTDPRLVRRNTGRGRSPRTQSSPRVDMIFPEVDVLGHNRSVRDSKLSQIRSSEDISSAYVPENSSSQDLLRTASVGGSSRTRSKVTRSTFTSIKRPGAAEDSDVVIEEMEDEGVPSSLLQNISLLPQADATVCLPYSKDIISEYLRFIVNNEIQERLGNNNNNVDKEYQQYLKLKEVYDSECSKDIEKPSVIESSETANLESDSSKKTSVIESFNKANPESASLKVTEKSSVNKSSNTANLESESSKVIEKSSVVESSNTVIPEFESSEVTQKSSVIQCSSVPIFGSETVNLESGNKILLQGGLAQEKISVHTQSIVLAPHVENENHIKKNDYESKKIPGIIISESKVKSDLINEEISVKSADSLSSLTCTDKRDSICEESRSIGASSSNLSSDDDMDDGEFTTPNSSPVMKNKINKASKYKKRHAPPPPQSHSSNSDKNEIENIDKQSQSSMKNDPSSDQILPLVEPGIIKANDLISTSGKESENLPSLSPDKRKQRTKNKSSVKSGSKNESPFSKLIHLPSKFAFWNTGESSDKLSASDNNEEESNDSINEKSSVSDYGSTNNLQTSRECQADDKPNINMGTEISVINKDKLVSESFKTVAIEASKNVAEGNDPQLKKDDKSPPDNGKPDNFEHIPLKIETLILHTESKSTDV